MHNNAVSQTVTDEQSDVTHAPEQRSGWRQQLTDPLRTTAIERYRTFHSPAIPAHIVRQNIVGHHSE
jgi:hypothetical protein